MRATAPVKTLRSWLRSLSMCCACSLFCRVSRLLLLRMRIWMSRGAMPVPSVRRATRAAMVSVSLSWLVPLCVHCIGRAMGLPSAARMVCAGLAAWASW